MKHVDEFIDGNFREDRYARWVLNHFRLPAVLKMDFDEFMADKKLFCVYNNEKYRVTGASRLGDIWLARDFNRTRGYDLRVDLAECSVWSDK